MHSTAASTLYQRGGPDALRFEEVAQRRERESSAEEAFSANIHGDVGAADRADADQLDRHQRPGAQHARCRTEKCRAAVS